MSRKNASPQKEIVKGATLTPAQELNADVDLKRLLEQCAVLGEFIAPFSKRVKVEYQRVRDGDQPNIPFVPLFVHGSISHSDLRALFMDILPMYPFLRVIQLHHCSIGDDGILVVVNFIRTYKPMAGKNPFGVQCVEVPGCQIGANGVKHIGTLLMECETLSRCVLDFNPLGDVGTKALASALRWNGTLGELSLQHCGIESVGAEALAEGALRGSNIRFLSLRGNAIGPEGIKHIGTALGLSSSIESIDVADTRFGHSYEAVREFCLGIGKSSTLTSVDMDFNIITPEAAPLIVALLLENKQLVEFRVHERMDSNYFCMIQNSLEQNGRAMRKKKKRVKG